MRFYLIWLFGACVILSHYIYPQKQTVLESGTQHCVIRCDFSGVYKLADTLIEGRVYTRIYGGSAFRSEGEPWLPAHIISLAVPFGSSPRVTIMDSKKANRGMHTILPYPKGIAEPSGGPPIFNERIYSENAFFPKEATALHPQVTFRFSRLQPLAVSPFRWNPVTRILEFTETVTFRVDFHSVTNLISSYEPVSEDAFTTEALRGMVINESAARLMMAKAARSERPQSSEYWYKPQYDWRKVYVRKEGVYRVTYEQLALAGLPLSILQTGKIQLYNLGKQVPLDMVDGKDGRFEPGDYFQFVGYPPPPSPFCRQNIYDSSNVYWLTYEGLADSSSRYLRFNGNRPLWNGTQLYSTRTDFYEKDVIFEPFGLAPDEQRDYWQWGVARGRNSSREVIFRAPFRALTNPKADSPFVLLRINFHGMTNYSCDFGHRAKILINGTEIGIAEWNGQTEYTWERTFKVHPDSVRIFPDGNYLNVECNGMICHLDKSDEIRVNWFELTYLSEYRAGDGQLKFTPNNEQSGLVRYWLWQWPAKKMKVYVPEQRKLIDSVYIANDPDRTVLIVDSLVRPSTYYAVTDSTFLSPDSIAAEKNSDLRNTANGADYIIIYHKDFAAAAARLKALRSTNFPDTSFTAPRVMTVDAADIYDEFSYGVFDPLALQSFVKYAFQNWAGRAPAYVVLIGDMSHDYRGILENHRPNFIPSIMYHSLSYGSAASDNAIVCVAGDDVAPDLAIGRLSIEKPEEGTVLLDKLSAYPQDGGKKWRENMLLLASGLSSSDELIFQFNDASMWLNDMYLRPGGYNTKMIFRYPNKPEHMRFQGSTAEIRAAIDEGAVLLNYYGHGGGYQWDLTFLNDDIYILQNGGRLPLIVSVTCYTAHFDNQDVFGEQFNKVPGKGSIGFFGSSGLTHWEVGTHVNRLLFEDMFLHRNFMTGSAFMKAKVQTAQIPALYYLNQVAMLTYLGDPALKLALPDKPDFALQNTDIWFDNQNPVVGDTLSVFARLFNYGIKTEDSVDVDLSFTVPDSSGLVSSKRVPVFGQHDTIAFRWIPSRGGLTSLNVRINPSRSVPEGDYADNQATAQIPVFDISEPNIVAPVNGTVQQKSFVEIVIADLGNEQKKVLDYTIEVDTATDFVTPLIRADRVRGSDGILRWNSPVLPKGTYFWRARMSEGASVGKWSALNTIEIADSSFMGYAGKGRQLRLFNAENMVYDANSGAMVLTKEYLPPKPTRDKFLMNIVPDDTASIRKTGLGAIATDGTYIYAGNMFYYISKYHGDSTGNSRIYKIGTGNNGTVAGKVYGTVPGFYHQIRDQFCYYRDGNLYVPTIEPRLVLRVNPQTGQTDSVTVPAGFLEKDHGTVRQGGFYLAADSLYVYNLAYKDSLGANRYSLRVFNPADNWRVVGDYYYPRSVSYERFCNFFVFDKYFYPYENFYSGFMRRYRISDGIYESEWLPWFDETPQAPILYYAWAFDRGTNAVYGTVYRPGGNFSPRITKFAGRYFEAKGLLSSPVIGPATRWNNAHFGVKGSLQPKNFVSAVEGYHSSARRWDTLKSGAFAEYDLRDVPSVYGTLKFSARFTDSSYALLEPPGLASLSAGYVPPPEIVLRGSEFTLSADSLYQGDDLAVGLTLRNIGKAASDTVNVHFTLDGAASPLPALSAVLAADSAAVYNFTLPTAKIPARQEHSLQAYARSTGAEYFTYNNVQTKKFYLIRDTVKPKMTVLFDGREIGDGDIVSARPRIEFRLRDNSPLPLDSSSITVFYNNRLLSYKNDSLAFSYTSAPQREAVVTWLPTLKKQTRHVLDIKGKDATGNFFTDDSGYYRLTFNIFEVNDLAFVYNYPNPFSEGTHFTFELRGVNKPEKITVKIFTIAGRLIKKIERDGSEFDFNRNKIQWDGRDADGNEIANGTYLYKIIAKFPDGSRTATQKLVKMK